MVRISRMTEVEDDDGLVTCYHHTRYIEIDMLSDILSDEFICEERDISEGDDDSSEIIGMAKDDDRKGDEIIGMAKAPIMGRHRMAGTIGMAMDDDRKGSKIIGMATDDDRKGDEIIGMAKAPIKGAIVKGKGDEIIGKAKAPRKGDEIIGKGDEITGMAKAPRMGRHRIIFKGGIIRSRFRKRDHDHPEASHRREQ